MMKMKRIMKRLNDMICYLFRHDYYVTKKITSNIYELKCRRCKKGFAINTWVKSVLPLDDELRRIHDFLKR